ncbi:MAG: hypothetical protein HYR64_06425 [Fimbriimonas ginsengisoli]|uniref:Uncharacterized protein n=1 Tax=Fimbriimonas ginsengisoli TaxID=1005039 RepID=A0A931LSM0_FIMGI|nr:hypothetical protein [Fimbriimonas ginsengisoli]
MGLAGVRARTALAAGIGAIVILAASGGAFAQRPPTAPGPPATAGNAQPSAAIVRRPVTVEIGLWQFRFADQGGRRTAPLADRPYLVTIGFQAKVARNPANPGYFHLEQIGVGPIGPSAHGDIPLPGGILPSTNYDITKETFSWRVDENDPGWLMGEVVLFFDQRQSLPQDVRAMVNEIAAVIRSDFARYGMKGSILTPDALTQMSLLIVTESRGYPILRAINGLAAHQVPDTYGSFNIVLASTYPFGQMKMFAGSPFQNQNTIRMATLVREGGLPYASSAGFTIQFPPGLSAAPLAGLKPEVRFAGRCTLQGLVVVKSRA